jgi:dynein heavy chain
MWVNFFDPDLDPKPYEEVYDLQKLNSILLGALNDYNADCLMRKQKVVDLVFFSGAIETIAKITRIINQTRGNALLLGVGGCGKQSLTRLSAYIVRCQVYEISLSKNYGQNEFREDLRKLYSIAGADGKSTVFLLNDTSISQESFLEDLNCILGSGEVPGLFDQQQKDVILKRMRESCGKEIKVPEHPDLAMSFLIDRVRDKLHIVLCMSPIGDMFRKRCRMFPSLVNCCSIVYVPEWNESALSSVSLKLLSDSPSCMNLVKTLKSNFRLEEEKKEKEKVELAKLKPATLSISELKKKAEADKLAAEKLQQENLERKDIPEKISNLSVFIHKSVEETSSRFFRETKRKVYVTPALFLEMINLFKKIVDEKVVMLKEQMEKYEAGLKVLEDTRESIGGMKEELKVLEPQLLKQQQQINELMTKITADKKHTEEVQSVISKEEIFVRDEAEKAKKLADEAGADLAEILPVFEAATRALESLSKAAVNEVSYLFIYLFLFIICKF